MLVSFGANLCAFGHGSLIQKKMVVLHFNFFNFLVVWNLKSNGRKIEWKVGKKYYPWIWHFLFHFLNTLFFSYLFYIVLFIIT
jgi:hypothetical protein